MVGETGPKVKCPKCLYEWRQRSGRAAKICCPNCSYSWIDKRRKKSVRSAPAAEP